MAQPEACMALPGPAKGLAVATVTFINYTLAVGSHSFDARPDAGSGSALLEASPNICGLGCVWSAGC